VTVTVKLQFAVPQLLDAVQVTVFVPIVNAYGDVMTVGPML
jgi:hypothetical protein